MMRIVAWTRVRPPFRMVVVSRMPADGERPEAAGVSGEILSRAQDAGATSASRGARRPKRSASTQPAVMTSTTVGAGALSRKTER